MLRLERVNAYYGDSHVLHDVSFGLAESRVLGLLGRNGAGKTTCISAIAGLLPARQGSIRLLGQATEASPPETISRLGVGLVPQGRRVFRSLTVQENLSVAARRREGDREWSFDRVFEIFPRLAERRRNFAGTLSGGEQQMLAIGRALMGNPRVLLLDEPSEGLAPQIVAELSEVFLRLKGEGMSILLVEQNLRLAMTIADEIVILANGVVVFEGQAANLERSGGIIEKHLGVH
ncbi:MAG: ABC transporter ATP-binding protein [Mesorhizobium sp.]|nr:MAG: ABC transporter ATP-binding protein [Mesorhizobium sp.]